MKFKKILLSFSGVLLFSPLTFVYACSPNNSSKIGPTLKDTTLNNYDLDKYGDPRILENLKNYLSYNQNFEYYSNAVFEDIENQRANSQYNWKIYLSIPKNLSIPNFKMDLTLYVPDKNLMYKKQDKAIYTIPLFINLNQENRVSYFAKKDILVEEVIEDNTKKYSYKEIFLLFENFLFNNLNNYLKENYNYNIEEDSIRNLRFSDCEGRIYFKDSTRNPELELKNIKSFKILQFSIDDPFLTNKMDTNIEKDLKFDFSTINFNEVMVKKTDVIESLSNKIMPNRVWNKIYEEIFKFSGYSEIKVDLEYDLNEWHYVSGKQDIVPLSKEEVEEIINNNKNLYIYLDISPSSKESNIKGYNWIKIVYG